MASAAAFAAFAAFVMCAVFALPAAGQGMEAGEWEIRTVISSPMMQVPQVATGVQCVTPEDARDPARYAVRSDTPGCAITPGARSASSYAWTVRCDGGMSGSGKARFAGKTFESEIRTSIDLQGVKMEILTATKGRRLGPCAAK
jgi:hypothetical protein